MFNLNFESKGIFSDQIVHRTNNEKKFVDYYWG